MDDKPYERKRDVLLFLLAPLFLLAVAGGMLVVVVLSDHDIANAYPSPENHQGVVRFHPPAPIAKNLPGSEEQFDFDGDGVPDQLSLEYYHMEPIFSPTTSGMVYVHSGATGVVLLAHAVSTPLDHPKWYGDFDSNGTTDILVQDEESAQGQIVLGIVEE